MLAVMAAIRPSDPISMEGYNAIQVGMSCSEVEAMLGPSGRHTTRLCSAGGIFIPCRFDCWYGEYLTICISFDDKQRVDAKRCNTEEHDEEPWLTWLLRRLRIGEIARQ
jgi:hypothetical protein